MAIIATNPVPEITCQRCGRKVRPDRVGTKFCSVMCQKKAWEKDHPRRVTMKQVRALQGMQFHCNEDRNAVEAILSETGIYLSHDAANAETTAVA